MAARLRDFDWSSHPLGAPERWPTPLKFAVDLALGSSLPSAVYWGRELVLIYNDAWAPIPAERHPWAIGRPGAEVWSDIWNVVGPQMDAVLDTGQGFASYDQMLAMERNGRPQETWWNYSFTPIRCENGEVVGILNQGNETTRSVLAERARLAEVARLREFFEQAPNPIALLHGPDHVFDIANAAYLELVGGRDIVGKTVGEALPEVIDQGFVALLDDVYAQGRAFRASGAEIALQRTPGGAPETRVLDFVYQPILDGNRNTTDIFVAVTDVTERTRAEEALRGSQERLELALESSIGVGTWFWDVPNNRVTADTRFLRLYGVDQGVAEVGAPIEQFFVNVHPDDLPGLHAAVSRSLETGAPLDEEYRLLQPDGSVRWVSAQGRCSFDARGRPERFPGVSFDITERREAEAAALEAADELRRANETQAFLYELAEELRALGSADLVMSTAARVLGEQLGLDRVGFYRVIEDRSVEFAASWSNGRLPPLSDTAPVEVIGPAAAGYRLGRTAVFHDAATQYPGTYLARLSPAGIGVPLLRGGRWIATFYANSAIPRAWAAEEIALVEKVAEIAWDAVERASATVALRESEAKFRGITNSIDPMIWSTLPNGFHDFYNDRWYEFTGVPRGTTDGEEWAGIFHPDDQSRAWELWRQSLATGDPYHIEYRLRHHSGAYRWVLGRAQPVRNDAGEIIRWFGTCTDIQDIVDAREVLARSREELETAIIDRTRQLMAAEEQLRQAQKMEAVGQLTGGIAHDFNNMLAVVIGALDLLERRVAQGRTDLDRYLTAARDGATRAAALTQRLLAFSRQQPLAPVPIDPNAMIEGMIELLMRTLGEDVTIETLLPEGVAAIVVDPNQLENVLLNLAVNARDAMPGGGQLILSTADVTLDGETARSMELDVGDFVEIAVVDTGLGMAPEVAARAFDPFFTTKGVGKGTGLGLSQVFGFLRQSGGAVRIETAQDSGTTVRLYLPAHHGQTPTPRASAGSETLPRAKAGETVLVVEDEERVRTYSIEALRELGYSVIDARDGREAMRIIDRGQRLSLLFSDVVMPEMTGRELAEKARARVPGLKVLLTSGYTPDVAGDDGSILTKPFDFAQLAQRVRKTLDS